MKRFFIQLSVAVFLLSVFSFRSLGADIYTLEFNLEKGKIYKQRSVSEMTMTINAMGQDMEMDMKTETSIHFNVVERNNDVYDISMSYQKIKMDMNVMQSYSIDSDSPGNSVLQSFIGIPIDIQLTKEGKVSIKDADQFATKIDAITDEQLKQIISQLLSEKAIQSTFERLSFFPGKPVAVGDSWDVTTNASAGGIDIINKLELTLKQVKDNIAILEVAGTLSTPEGGAVMQVNGMDAEVSAKGIQTGTIRIDIKTGWIVGSEINQKSTQNIEIMGYSIPQEVEIKLTVTAD